jgi:hypothetical protein
MLSPSQHLQQLPISSMDLRRCGRIYLHPPDWRESQIPTPLERQMVTIAVDGCGQL